jgi:hypothetical protein
MWTCRIYDTELYLSCHILPVRLLRRIDQLGAIEFLHQYVSGSFHGMPGA